MKWPKPQMLAKWRTRTTWPAQRAVSKSGRHLAVTELGPKPNGLRKASSHEHPGCSADGALLRLTVLPDPPARSPCVQIQMIRGNQRGHSKFLF